MLLRAMFGHQNRFDAKVPGPIPYRQHLTGPVNVNADTALTLPVASRCVQVIADSIGRLPLHAYRDGRKLEPTPSLLTTPEPGYTRMETISAMVTSLLLHGNAYAIIADRDYLGHPTSLVLVAPQAVGVRQVDGRLIYTVSGVPYDAEEILHVRGLTMAGSMMGQGVISMQRRAFGQAIAAEDYAGELWTTGAVPDGVLQMATEIDPDEAAALKAAFVASNGGRQRGPAVLSGGITYNPIAWSNVDLEFLESRKWNAVQVCQAFGVPTIFAMVPSGESKTYQNVQQDSQAFVRYTLGPWLARIESALAELLPRGQSAQFNLDGMLRDETLDRYNAHKIGLEAGFLTVEEVRDLENLDPDTAPPPPQPVPAALEGDDGE